MKKNKVNIPEPCTEDFSAMPKTAEGMYCSKCEKEVIDFSHSSLHQVNHRLALSGLRGEKICGYFNARHVTQKKGIKIPKNFKKWPSFVCSILGFYVLTALNACKIRERTGGPPLTDNNIGTHLNAFDYNCENDSLQGGSNKRDDTQVFGGAPVMDYYSKKTINRFSDSTFLAAIGIENKIYFDKYEASLSSKNKKILDAYIMKLGELSEEDSVLINGHADSRGDKGMNDSLSLKRAEVVKEYFVSKGVVQVIQVKGFGSSFPISNNTSHAGRAKNRRIEIIVVREK